MTTEDVVRRLRAFEMGKPAALRRDAARSAAVRRTDADPRVRQDGRGVGAVGHCLRPSGQAAAVLTMPEPRTRDDVAEMVSEFAPALLTHVHHPRFSPFGPDPEARLPPFQVWLPNDAHLEMLHHLAYAYTFTKFGSGSRHLLLNQLGHACGWLFREAQRPGQMVDDGGHRRAHRGVHVPGRDDPARDISVSCWRGCRPREVATRG